MIAPITPSKVLIATRPVDFRKGMGGLAALVKSELGGEPFSGVVYVFRAKKADRIKLVWWDGTGLCLMSKRLENGRFGRPAVHDGVMRLSLARCLRGSAGNGSTRPGVPRCRRSPDDAVN